MKIFLITFFLLFTSAVVRAETIEFAGYALLPDGPVFTIHNAMKKEFSPWVKIGQEWSEYKVVSFDQEHEALTVLKGDAQLVLVLRSSKIGEDKLKLPNKVTGSFTLVDGTVVYSEDAVVRMGSASISSSAGVMVSDKEQKQLVGDLKIGNATFENGRAIEKDGIVIVTSEKVVIRNEK
jgi:hypothetical protein